MKTLIAVFAFLPVAALAHGTHAPVPDPMHGFAHLVPAFFLIALLIVVGLMWRMRQ